jgi:hypothetical protein
VNIEAEEKRKERKREREGGREGRRKKTQRKNLFCAYMYIRYIYIYTSYIL